jgi:hypothetical protein
MHDLVEKLVAAGGILVARSGYDASTEDLDAMADVDTGRLSIAELELDAEAMTRQVADITDQLAPGETLLIDLTGRRTKVQLLPVPGDHGVIVRRYDGLRRFPRRPGGMAHRDSHWLKRELTQRARA